MKVNVTHPIRDFSGRIALNEKNKEVTFRDVVSTALGSAQEKLTQEQKAKCFLLGVKIFTDDTIDLTIEEASLIKERVDATYPSPVICGRVNEILEQAANTPANKPTKE